jgi:hypothetical protein
MLKTQMIPPICPACPACPTNTTCTNCGGTGGAGTHTDVSGNGWTGTHTDVSGNWERQGYYNTIGGIADGVGDVAGGALLGAGALAGGVASGVGSAIGGLNHPTNVQNISQNSSSLTSSNQWGQNTYSGSTQGHDQSRVGYYNSQTPNMTNGNYKGFIDPYSYSGALNSKGGDPAPITSDFSKFGR